MKIGVFGLFLLLFFTPVGFANPVQGAHIEVALISEVTTVKAGEPFTVALRLQPETHWHTYWRNAGDSGMPPRVQWQTPEGVKIGEFQWAYPERVPFAHLMNFGYSGESFLLAQVTTPADYALSELHLQANARWLVCEKVCIPGEAVLNLTLPVTHEPAVIDKKWQSAFAKTRAQLPIVVDWQAQFQFVDNHLVLKIQNDSLNPTIQSLAFFPIEKDLIHNAAPQAFVQEANILFLRIPQHAFFKTAPAVLTGVLVITRAGKTDSYEITAKPDSVLLPATFLQAQRIGQVADNSATINVTTEVTSFFNLLLMLGFAILGGIILNLMPCVFPILALKAVSLAESQGLSVERQRWHGVIYTVGVGCSFLLIAGLLLGLRMGGASIGWGFQLQSPLFVAILTYLFFAMALSLSGVVSFGTRLMGIGDSLATQQGYRGSFFTGMLAVIVASPCSAPFMGTAIGFALLQPTGIALLVFLALGMGMALPFLLLTLFPQWARFLPRAGAWMNTFKQFMAFPLYLTVVWLLWILGRQTNVNGMAIVLIGLVLLAFALWVWGHNPHVRPYWQWLHRSLSLCAMGLAIALLNSSLLTPMTTATAIRVDSAEQRLISAYSAEKLAQLRTEGKAVFVNLTADWCITCLVNEQVALETPVVQQAFIDKKIHYLKGDWTNVNPEITALLTQFKRSGVPLYLYYAVNASEPVVLPQLLTPTLILDVLNTP
ncbi:thiol:disulfide interchange protein [Beggiatoa alba B18LD]|uniref:Thiol:disulfide interchange protein n=1 Tax=Beggiatoa alba B18LD TaxID=395493 RepID=I3CF44_9GAMM|nr:thioredoxin family protein [Beggiatoa alba]EIJ42237.1 thiol:disulfide interchange protein [Beggiatoa alba B18LD]